MIFGIAIFILTIAVAVYGINTILGKAPQYDKICPPKNIVTENDCILSGGTWSNYTYADPQYETKPISPNGYCDTYTYCQPLFDEANGKYSRNVFFIALPLGIIVVIVGALIFGLEAVGVGLMAGGIGIILYGISSVWSYADDLIKFIISLIGLIIVILVTYYANNKFNFLNTKKKK